MARLVSNYEDIKFTILPHYLDTENHNELARYPSSTVIGYATYDKKTQTYKFFDIKSGYLDNHWLLTILKNHSYYKKADTWILFNCQPHKTKMAFQQILNGDSINISEWDTWSIEDINAKVAVVTSWENT